MWKCRDCGSTEIRTNIVGDFEAAAFVNGDEYGSSEFDTDYIDIINSHIEDYECLECGAVCKEFDDIAEYVDED